MTKNIALTGPENTSGGAITARVGGYIRGLEAKRKIGSYKQYQVRTKDIHGYKWICPFAKIRLSGLLLDRRGKVAKNRALNKSYP